VFEKAKGLKSHCEKKAVSSYIAKKFKVGGEERKSRKVNFPAAGGGLLF